MKVLWIWLRVVFSGAVTALSSAALASAYDSDPALMGYRGFIVGVVFAPAVTLLAELIDERRARRARKAGAR